MNALLATSLYQWLMFLHVLAAMIWLGGVVAVIVLASGILRSGRHEDVARFIGNLGVLGPLTLGPASLAVLGLGIGLVLDWLPRIFLSYERLLENGRVVRDRAVEVDVGRVALASGDELRADFLVLATGSRYPYPAKTDADDTSASIGRYCESHDALARAQRVLILGAGPVGLELAGEISSAWPHKHVTILEPQPDIVAGPFKQELRDELRRQLAERKVELLLGEALEQEPPTPPTTHGSFTVRTSSGRTIEAEIWFRCYGVHPVSDYLAGELAAARRADGFIEVTPTLQVAGQTAVFALGDVSSIDSKMAGRATRQAETVAANIRALIDEPRSQTTNPPRPRS